MNEVNAINFEDDQLERVNDSGLLSIADCCQRLVDLENEASTLEDQLKHIKEEMLSIRNEKIPAIMQEKNLTQLKLNDGSSIEIRNFYGISVPKDPDQRAEAYQWLRDNNLGDIIKNEITVAFGRHEDNKASQYAVLAQGQGYEPVQKLKVEPMTLKALVRERIESGREIPSDLFNVYAGNRTSIKRK